MAAPDRLRENSRPNAEDGRDGRGPWYLQNPMEEILNLTRADQAMSSSIEAVLGTLAELCGIYEWKAKGIRPDQPNNVVLYVGGMCGFRNLKNWGAELSNSASTERVIKKI